MYLRSIEMKGFKSFPERARLEFSPGVSVIVGPNGSGKSNITDAVLWALGEQSPGAIRGASMQDVISAGGKGVGQRRAAEVEVTIDNSEGRAATELSEIAIKRTLDRSGDGSYRLNGARCRLVDVAEVLSDTNLGREMHSVISQGRVESIVHSKPRERRLLVEEAAGLGKHRKRRRRAELKLRAARDNLDRAFDLEREARARLRPLKRQAQAAELGARIEREELGLRGRLVAEELRFGADRAAAAEKAASEARAQRAAIEKTLAEVSEKRRAAEERFAVRDRERTQAWGVLTKLRGEQQRIAIRATGLADREGEISGRLEALRAELGPLTLDVGGSEAAPGERARKLEEELDEIDAGLSGAADGLRRARSAAASEASREAALGAVRSGAERATRHARRAEGLLGERAREVLRKRLAAGEELLDDVRAAAAAATATEAAIRARVERIEQRVVGGEGDSDEIADEMRACSQREYELQAQMTAASDLLTEVEVEAAHLGDRRAEAAKELASIAERLGEEVEPATVALGEEERTEIDRRLGRLERRRAQIGPVNPLAEQEYEEAREHVESLQAQREDTERGMRELEALIRDIDREIERAFEQTFEATAKNFEEMVEHLFPGGRGRLRRVSLRPVPDAEAESEESSGAGGVEEGEDDEEEREELGVEIEVTPAGKSTRKLSLLSGGEKSLVAIAFVFAVFLARPCPFYILDEVEAALDDANIDRFLQLIRRFSDRAQFVIVTHQKRTMDAADVLYGVSMGGDGVTKVVSRRLPREIAEDGGQVESAAAPPPFAGVAEDEPSEGATEEPATPGLIGEQPPAAPAPRGSVEAA
ncbi:MAG: chromosome segregation protein [Solirubrobacterales bacterium]|jgi:chromosome segregation protein|nr:chromosome segregation protein [Solirubrobacterales bacterium]